MIPEKILKIKKIGSYSEREIMIIIIIEITII